MKTTTIVSRTYLLIMFCFSLFLNLQANNTDAMFSIFCPDNVTLNCTDELWDLSIYGNATYHDYTGYHDAGEPVVTYNLNECNVGNIIRTWSAVDYTGYAHTCSQVIHVTGNAVNSGDIDWPENIELEGCNPATHPDALPPGYDRPDWNFAACSILGTNWTDKLFDFGPGCYKIIREWNVIDCCTFNPITGEGSWTHFQVINVTSGDTPVLTCPQDVEVSTTNCQYGEVELPDLIVDQNCNLPYMVLNDSPYATSNGANASGNYPIGTHTVTFMVKYGCWQTEVCSMTITVLDDKKPQPICLNGLAIALMGVDTDGDAVVDNGMVEIWASDFDHGSYHPCNIYEDLIFSFSADVTETSKIFTCEDVGENEVEIWVTDEDGNQNYCTTQVDIQNNGANIPDCEPMTSGNISGNIASVFHNTEQHMRLNVGNSASGIFIETTYDTTEIYVLVDSVINNAGIVIYHYDIEEEITATHDTTIIDKDFFLKVKEGNYIVEDLPFDENYILELELTDKTYEFIDLSDVHVLQKYLEGSLDLTAHQMLAADLNHDKQVDFADLELLTGYINGTIEASDIDLSWYSLNGNIELQDPAFVLNQNLPAYHFIEDHSSPLENIDLMIFQMGDLTDELVSSEGNNVKDAHALDISHDQISNRGLNQESPVELMGHAPNPFNNEAVIFINNPKDQLVQFEVFDLRGQKISSEQLFMLKGYQQLHIDGSQIANSGIIIYSIKADQTLIKGKLVKE